jgi:hypothetical protein
MLMYALDGLVATVSPFSCFSYQLLWVAYNEEKLLENMEWFGSGRGEE